MKYKLVIFDFDGTLADSFDWFIGVLDKVADKYKFKKIEKSDIDTMRNSDATKMLKHHGITWLKVPFIGKHLRELMAEDIHKVSLFGGIGNLLQSLSENRIIIAVVTSNSYENVCKILGASNSSLIKYYECGVSIFGKPPKLKKIVRQSGISSGSVIFIGDEIRDIDAARKAGIKFGAVSWGYTNLEALKAHSPDEVFSTVDEILEKII
jgi:phosphoglycolate phosphatase